MTKTRVDSTKIDNVQREAAQLDADLESLHKVISASSAARSEPLFIHLKEQVKKVQQLLVEIGIGG